MTVNAVVGTPFSAYASDAPPGLVGTLGVRVVNSMTGVEALPRTTANIVELVYSSGLYKWNCLGLPAGSYLIVWDTNGEAPLFTEEELEVTALAPRPPPGVIAPSTNGFLAGAKRLRSLFGDTITFSLPQDAQWPVGTKINTDTGEPYSAMIVRENPEYVTVTAVCLVIIKEASPLRPQADTQWAEVGLMSGMDIILDVDADDFPLVGAASEFRYTNKNYKVEETKPFTIGDTLYRYLMYGKER